jgi:transcriptional regulator with XRE-family HTH domain
MHIGVRLREAREEAGLTQDAAALRIGVHRMTVGRWESGETTPTITQLPILCRVYGKDPAWFYAEPTTV